MSNWPAKLDFFESSEVAELLTATLNFNDLNFKDGQFDVIFSSSSLEPTGVQEALDEAVRCLRPDGELIISFDLTQNQFMDSNSLEPLTLNSIENWSVSKNMELLSTIEIKKNIENKAILKLLTFLKLLPMFEGKVNRVIYHLKKK